MKKTSLGFILIFTIIFGSLLVIPFINLTDFNSESNNPVLDSIDSPNQPELVAEDDVTDTYISGEGKQVKTGLYANVTDATALQTPFLETSEFKLYDLPINTYNQNITQTNLSFSNVNAKNTTITVEDNPEVFLSTYMAPGLYIGAAMSFKIPTTCKLKQIQLFLQEVDYLSPPDWNITIWNATRDLNEDLLVKPDHNMGIEILQPATDLIYGPAAHWQNFTFQDVQLNMSNTYIDGNGFAYYYFVIVMPPNTTNTDQRFLYLAYDRVYIDGGYAYIGSQVGMTLEYDYYPIDVCLKMELAPLNNTPSPSDISMAVMNPNRPPPTNLTSETNHTIPIHAAWNETDVTYLLAQNFTLSEYGTIHDISLYIKSFGNTTVTMVGIFPKNDTGIGPKWDANLLYDLNVTLNLVNNTEGWFNFTQIDQPNLVPGEYYWVCICQSTENLTLYGTKDSPQNNEVALNISGEEVSGQTQFNTTIIDGHFATIIYYQPGKESFSVTKDWINDSRFLPDPFGYYHFNILSRWPGQTSFDVTHTIELENNILCTPLYYTLYNVSTVVYDLTIYPYFPSMSSGKVINLSFPTNWVPFKITRNGTAHFNNKSYSGDNVQILSIQNASAGVWNILCYAFLTPTSFSIEKYSQGQFQPADNATIYDRIQVNVTIENQTNGICYLTIFYPNGRSSFTNQTQITSENVILSFNPEYDPDASGGNYTFIVHWSNGTKLGWCRQYFYFTPIPANVTILTTIPEPYVDDITRSIVIKYNDSRGVNITGATIYAELGGNILDWEDIYGRTRDPIHKGKYQLELNTTGLNDQSYTLNGWIAKVGYENVTFSPIQITVLPVPTSLYPNVPNITQYQDELVSFSCSFKDIFHGLDIDWATVNYEIIDTNLNGTLTNIMTGESVYIAENVRLTNLTDRGTPYQINFTATADNCQADSTIIELFVKNKTKTSLSLLDPIGSYIQGRSIRIRARLLNTSSLEGIPNATIRFSFAGVIPERIALTDGKGIAEIEIAVPAESFTITVHFDETSRIAEALPAAIDVPVITYGDIALWIGIIIGALVVSIFLVRQFYIVPKRNRQEKRHRKIANKFADVANLRQLLILHRESSGCLYQESIGGEIDGDLISGFLSAISSFQSELKVDKLPRKEATASGFELNYEDYKIIVFPGKLINIALIFDETPSEEFRYTVQNFVQEYESHYHEYLVGFRGNITPFKDSSQFIADKLELNLTWPHHLHRPSVSVKLSSLEETLIQIADTIMQSQVQDYFFLPLVISMAQAGRPKSKLEVIAAVYQLRKRTIFRPIPIEAIS